MHHLHYNVWDEVWEGKESDSPWHDLITLGEVAPGTNLA